MNKKEKAKELVKKYFPCPMCCIGIGVTLYQESCPACSGSKTDPVAERFVLKIVEELEETCKS